MVPASSDPRIKVIEDRVSPALEKPDHVRSDFASVSGWAVVPIDANLMYTAALPALISSAAQTLACKECYAFPVEPLLNPDKYVVAMKTTDLMEFARVCGHLKYVLVPESTAFLILCNFEADYCLVCGRRDFVEAAVGKRIAAARQGFVDWIKSFDPEDPATEFLSNVSRRYETCNDTS